MASLPESLGKGVVVNLELSDLLVLIRRDCNEGRFFEDVRPERRVGQLHDITGSDKVKARLVLVHGVENCLKGRHKQIQELVRK